MKVELKHGESIHIYTEGEKGVKITASDIGLLINSTDLGSLVVDLDDEEAEDVTTNKPISNKVLSSLDIQKNTLKILRKVLDLKSDKKVKMEDNLVDDLNADDLDMIELILSLEEEFNMYFPEKEFKEVKTVGDIISYLETRMKS